MSESQTAATTEWVGWWKTRDGWRWQAQSRGQSEHEARSSLHRFMSDNRVFGYVQVLPRGVDPNHEAA